MARLVCRGKFIWKSVSAFTLPYAVQNFGYLGFYYPIKNVRTVPAAINDSTTSHGGQLLWNGCLGGIWHHLQLRDSFLPVFQRRQKAQAKWVPNALDNIGGSVEDIGVEQINWGHASRLNPSCENRLTIRYQSRAKQSCGGHRSIALLPLDGKVVTTKKRKN
jgi:hypothetical protein